MLDVCNFGHEEACAQFLMTEFSGQPAASLEALQNLYEFWLQCVHSQYTGLKVAALRQGTQLAVKAAEHPEHPGLAAPIWEAVVMEASVFAKNPVKLAGIQTMLDLILKDLAAGQAELAIRLPIFQTQANWRMSRTRACLHRFLDDESENVRLKCLRAYMAIAAHRSDIQNQCLTGCVDLLFDLSTNVKAALLTEFLEFPREIQVDDPSSTFDYGVFGNFLEISRKLGPKLRVPVIQILAKLKCRRVGPFKTVLHDLLKWNSFGPEYSARMMALRDLLLGHPDFCVKDTYDALRLRLAWGQTSLDLLQQTPARLLAASCLVLGKELPANHLFRRLSLDLCGQMQKLGLIQFLEKDSHKIS